MEVYDKGHAYWTAPLRLLTRILVIWFLVSFGAGILFADLLNHIKSGRTWYGETFDLVTTYNFQFETPNLVPGEPVILQVTGASRTFTILNVGVRPCTVDSIALSAGLDAFTCTECGRCKDACPTFLTGKPLSMKMVNDSLKHHLVEQRETLIAHDPKNELPALVGPVIGEETLWACTTCGYCEAACPIELEHLDKFFRLRQHQVMIAGEFPHELKKVFEAYESQGNPWGHCLNFIPEGAGMLICAHRPFSSLQPYAETGPIFLCADDCPRFEDAGVPPVLTSSPDYLLKGYRADERIFYGTGRVVAQADLPGYAATLLKDHEVAFVDVRSARNNCFQARIMRAD